MEGERSNETDSTMPYVSDVDDDTNPPPPKDTFAGIEQQYNIRLLENTREQALLQVAMAANEVSLDAGDIMHQGATHYLVDKDVMDELTKTLRHYRGANEDYISAIDGTDATPSTNKEL